jgi:hypothetical protein
MLQKLVLRPDSDGYSETEGSEVDRVELDGGVGRYMLDKIGATKRVQVKWTMNPSQYQYWRAFFVTTTQRGVLPFLCELVGPDGAGPAEYVCNFIPGSVVMPAQQGYTYVQAATLEVVPIIHDSVFDAFLVELYSIYQDEAWYVLSALAVLINQTAPAYLHE